MGHRDRGPEQDGLLRARLTGIIDMRHELLTLAALIDWEWFEHEWAGFFPAKTGVLQHTLGSRAGLMYLQHVHKLSDEAVVARWVETPYFQHFTGETFFQHRPPIHPSSLSRWRDRIGEDGAEWLLTKTIEAGRKSGTIDHNSVCRVVVDTTVMEKTIAHPTDARLYERARSQLVELAREMDVKLRQSYARLAPRLARQVVRYAHARQFKRVRKALKRLKGYTGRVLRDLRRYLSSIPEGALRDRVAAKCALVSRLLHQQPTGGDKIYALHEPEVDCISKGKARVRYEFGCKVSVATTLDEGFVVVIRSFPGNPYDGHTLHEALEQVEILTDQRPELVVVDRGYRGHNVRRSPVLISGMKRGLTPGMKTLMRRRSAIEPEIGHMKSDGRLARCPLKGTTGDTIFAVLCGCGHNLRKILAHLRALLLSILGWLRHQADPSNSRQQRVLAV